MEQAAEKSQGCYIVKLPVELRFMLLELVVIGGERDLGCRQMKKEKQQMKNLFMLLKYTTEFNDMAQILENKYANLTEYHKIFLTFQTLHYDYGTLPFYCQIEKFNKMEALEQAVRKESRVIERMVEKNKKGKEWSLTNVDKMIISAQLDVVELSLKLHVTSRNRELKYLSIRMERDEKGDHYATLKLTCCGTTILQEPKCTADCKRFKEFAIKICSTGN